MARLTTAPTTGTGLLAVFCDLDGRWLADFRPWLAEEMFPPRLAIGFRPAGSFDALPQIAVAPGPQTGMPPQAYLTAYVTPALGDLYGAPYQTLRTVRAPRDAAFHQRMTNHARYTASWVGPGIEDGAAQSFGPVIAVDRFDVAEADLQRFAIWIETDYLPACLHAPGLVRLRRYLAMEGPHKHLMIHEFTDAAALAGEAWTSLRMNDAWRAATFAPGAPAAYRLVLGA